MEQDLNDLLYFARVVEHGGFAPAGRALGIPKSKLSRRVSMLEERLGVRLLHRSSRHFHVTDIGQVYVTHCQAMLAEAQSAQEAIERSQAEPRGQVRLSCPVTLAQSLIGDIVAEFMALHPHVSVFMEVTNRRIDVIEEGLDLALRVRAVLEDSALVMRSFGTSRLRLVASPAFVEQYGMPTHPDELAGMPSLGLVLSDGRYTWPFEGPEGSTARFDYTPRLLADDFIVLRKAAIAGVGLTAMPEYMCREAIQSGELVHVMPQWLFPISILHAVFPSRRGLMPAVRSFIDYMAQRLPQLVEEIGM